jgi:hypothetical protein
MDMRANLLPSFRRSKHSDDRNFGFLIDLRGLDIVSKEGIKLGRRRLVIVYAVQPDTEEFHREELLLVWRAHWIVDRSVHG